MFDPTAIPPPPPAAPGRHSRIGIASFVISLLAVLVFCLAILVSFGYGFTMASQDPSFQVDRNSPTILVLGLVMYISPLMSLVSLGLGIAAVVQKSEKKLFGILGLVISVLILLSFCLLFVIGIAQTFGAS